MAETLKFAALAAHGFEVSDGYTPTPPPVRPPMHTYDITGTTPVEWPLPEGVTEVYVQAWGSGAGGANVSAPQADGGVGGGSGGYVSATLGYPAVGEGKPVQVVTTAGGAKGGAQAGGASIYLGGQLKITAGGGKGSAGGTTSYTPTDGVADVIRISGNAGAAASGEAGGAGGSAPMHGGAGGAGGKATLQAGSAGVEPGGGGGGGGGNATGGPDIEGGAGGPSMVRITWFA